MKFRIFAVFAFLSIALSASAQETMPTDRAAFYRYGNDFLTDFFVQPGKTADSIEFTLLYKIAYDALVFVQNPSGNGFFSVVQTEAAFRDESGIIRRRITSTDTIFVDSYNETISKTTKLIGVLQTNLQHGKYSILMQYSDSKNKVLNKSTLEMPQSSNSYSVKPAKLSAIYAFKDGQDFTIYQLKNGASFSSNPLTIFVPLSYKSQEASFTYIIKKKEDKTQAEWGTFQDISGSADVIENKKIAFSIHSQKISATIDDLGLPATNLNFGMIKIDVSGNSFVPGSFDLLLVNDKSKDTSLFDFKIIWEDMPLSLRNPEYAAKMMEYILTEDEYREMKSGSMNEIMKKIFTYWRAQDPTPSTPYNEAMAEYFRRVDYAFFNYQTISEKDGALTDMGMVYILYGAPDDVRRTKANDKTQEIWVYSRMIKEFTFDLVSTGLFKLTSIKE